MMLHKPHIPPRTPQDGVKHALIVYTIKGSADLEPARGNIMTYKKTKKIRNMMLLMGARRRRQNDSFWPHVNCLS